MINIKKKGIAFMINSTSQHMMEKPYIKDVISELKILGYEEILAKKILIKYYRPLKRSLGFELNAYDFAKELDLIDKANQRKIDPSDPNMIYIGHLKIRMKSNN